jgi:hypothetical protein
MEVRAEKQNVAPQNEQHNTRGNMTDEYTTRDKLDSCKVATIEKARVLANLAGFSVHSSSEFKFGKVFKVLWSEPVGSGGTEVTVPTKSRSKTAFQAVRHYLIVKSGERQSMCM